MSERKPIKVFYSPFTERFYATRAYKRKGDIFIITGEKYDVTDDIASSIEKHGLTFSKKRYNK